MSLINFKKKSRSKIQFADMEIGVVVGSREGAETELKAGFFKSIKGIIEGLISLWKGMKITGYYFMHPKTIITQQYPENRESLKMFDRFRGQLRLIKDEQGLSPCNGCGFCERACPNKSIFITPRKNPVNNKSELDRFVWRMDSCTFCNACIQACPHSAIEWANVFESAVYDKRLLVYQLNSYAGPSNKIIHRAIKKGEDVEALKNTMEPRSPYESNVPLGGKALPGVHSLQKDNKKNKGEIND